jgi:5-methylcytosine-specific restriction endonuclease McrA
MEHFKPSWMPRQPAKQYETTDTRKADKSFYKSPEWRAVRLAVLIAALFACADCGGKADHVHHIIERKHRPDLALEPSNLQAVCRECHNSKRRKDLR